jgi:hypothetical protein
MSWLLFMDESGHDHRNMPLEVRGGVAIHASKLWGFIQAWQRLERDCFGALLSEFGKEAKGCKLLDRDRMQWAIQSDRLADDLRRKNARRFLSAGVEGSKPTREDFAAYGQACQEMARGVFDLLEMHDARLFAVAIPRGVKPPKGYARPDYLRKDHVYLFERFFYFLEEKHEHGLVIMDQSEKTLDRRFISCMEAYFTRTAVGRNRSYWIVPAPLFVSSDMTYAVQAADICLYALNWGFRPPAWGEHQTREEIASEFGPKLARLQWSGQGYRDGKVYQSRGITLVPDPYQGTDTRD